MKSTVVFARKAVRKCEEYIFLDKLQYLVEGGRLSKTSAFFGDMLNMKPVMSPQPEGAKKVGMVRNQEDQVKMALSKLAASLKKDSQALIMLEYSDNQDWVEIAQLKRCWKTLSAGGNYSTTTITDFRRTYGAGDLGNSVSS